MEKLTELEMVAMVAMTPNRVIGHQGSIPWNNMEDLKLFKRTTVDHVVIMGRKTFQSLKAPLKNRINIVFSRKTEEINGAMVVSSLDELKTVLGNLSDKTKAFVIGGAEIYNLLLPYCDSVILSQMREEYEGDTFMPQFEELFPYVQPFYLGETFDAWEFSENESIKKPLISERLS